MFSRCIVDIKHTYLGNSIDCSTAVMAAPPLLTSGRVRYEAMFHSCATSLVCLFYAIATLFQLYHGGDIMHEMRMRKPEPRLIPTQGIFNFPHHIGIV